MKFFLIKFLIYFFFGSKKQFSGGPKNVFRGCFFFLFFFLFLFWQKYFFKGSKIICLKGSKIIFKATALWPDAFYKSKCPSVRLSVCLCVRSLLRYRLTIFLPPFPEVGCPILLEIRNPWGKVMERSGLRYEHFSLKLSKIAAQKKAFFLSFFHF